MRRRDIFRMVWREALGVLPAGSRVVVAGAGPSGLHLATALAQCGLKVTVYDPARTGGVRIPLLHACNSPKAGSPLWQAASRFARVWYADATLRPAVESHAGTFGEYFSIHTRTYLRLLKRLARAVGVQFVHAPFPVEISTPVFIATGAASQAFAPASWSAAFAPLPGWESYFALRPKSRPVAEELIRSDVRTNYFTHRQRAGFIHLNRTTRSAAQLFGAALHPEERHALFRATRLTTRDRLPVAGFSLPGEITDFSRLRIAVVQGRLGELLRQRQRIFFFTGMGFHAMTYSPFLAHRVAQWLTGQGAYDEILLGALTPARFLPR
jgi:glycine/D-amino acid oxidase-like deaminating enzyme